MAKLVLHRPDGTMRDVALDRDRVTIGRRADNDLCLPFPAVSADHAEIITVEADSFLHDMGSTNGTVVNGSRVTKHFLRNHDRIDIGRQQLVYLTNDAETIEPLLLPDLASHEMRSLMERMQAGPEVAHQADAPIKSSNPVTADAPATPVDALLTDLMQMQTESSVAVDMPPAVSVVPPLASLSSPLPRTPSGDADKTGGAVVEVLSGPNAGQMTPMTKSEFVLGKAGVTMAAIRRDGGGYRLLIMNRSMQASLNGRPVAADGARLAFGDVIDVAGVKLRFARGPSV